MGEIDPEFCPKERCMSRHCAPYLIGYHDETSHRKRGKPSPELIAYLSSDGVRMRTDDDTTLILATRVPMGAEVEMFSGSLKDRQGRP